MEDSEIKKIWQNIHQNMEKIISIDQNQIKNINQNKMQNLFQNLKFTKIFAILIAICWILTLGGFLGDIYFYRYAQANKIFLFSATAQLLLTNIAFGIYIYQLVKIQEIDIFDNVLKMQESITKIKISTLWIVKILILQLPLWTIFWWNEKMFITWQLWQWVISFSITLCCVWISLWLFLNIKYENRQKKWFKLIFGGSEWRYLIKIMDLMEQIEDYKEKENK